MMLVEYVCNVLNYRRLARLGLAGARGLVTGHLSMPVRTKNTQETRSPDSKGRFECHSWTSARMTSPGR